METWQRRYKDRKQEKFQKYYDKLIETEKPGHIRPDIFKQVVYETAMRMAHKYMTSLRTGERNV